jgi:urease accessory protein
VARAVRVVRADEPRGAIKDTVILTHDERRGRGQVLSSRGVAIELDLPPVALCTDDVLALDNGEFVEVVAAAEPLLEVRADIPALARIAWALGDRHVSVQILPNRLRLRADPGYQALVVSLGGRVAAIEAPFEPEGGAYEVGHDPAHDHPGDHHHDHGDHDHRHHDHDHMQKHR